MKVWCKKKKKKKKKKKNDVAIKQTAVMTQLNYRGFFFWQTKVVVMCTVSTNGASGSGSNKGRNSGIVALKVGRT